MTIDLGTMGATEGNILGFSPWHIIHEEFHKGNVASFASIANAPAAQKKTAKTNLIPICGISTGNTPC
jgi:molybdenum cofactor biosynthesis enzyme